jgi:hypothetical protein
VEKLKFTTVLLVLAGVAGAWWLFTYGPVYVDHLEVKEAATQIINIIPTSNSNNPHDYAANSFFRLNANVGYHFEVDEETGVENQLPGLGLTIDDNLTVETEGKRTTVVIEYDRVVPLKPFKKRDLLHFRAVVTTKQQ